MVIVVFAGFFIVFYDSTTSIFPRRVSQLHRHSCLGKRPFGPSGHCCHQRMPTRITGTVPLICSLISPMSCVHHRITGTVPLICSLISPMSCVHHKCGSIVIIGAKVQNKREYTKCPKLGVPFVSFPVSNSCILFSCKIRAKNRLQKVWFFGILFARPLHCQ